MVLLVKICKETVKGIVALLVDERSLDWMNKPWKDGVSFSILNE